MTHHKRSRIGVLPRWQRLSSHLIFLFCILTGSVYFLMHELHLGGEGGSARNVLIAHGVSTYLILLVFGAVLPGHVRAAWNAHKNRGSGILMVTVLVILMGSGLMLYYGAEESHDLSLWTHWGVGALMGLAFPLHLVLGRRSNRIVDRHKHLQLVRPARQA